MRWAWLVFSALMLAGGAAGGEMPESGRIGPYVWEATPEGVEIRAREARSLRTALAVGAGLCLAAAVGLTLLGAGAGAGAGVAAVGLALAIAAAAVRPGPDRVAIRAGELEVRGFVGRQGVTPVSAIERIEVRRRTPTGAETKRSQPPRVWQVTVRGRAGEEAVVRFRLASREDATELATRLGARLGRPVAQREGIAR